MDSLFAKNTPRWIIFTFDVCASIFALIIAYLLRFNFHVPASEYKFLPIAFISLCTVRVIFYYFFKTYAGIIRYTSTQDATRIFQSTVVGTVSLAALNLVRFYFIDAAFLLPFSVLVIEFLTTTFVLISFRIGVKVLYFELKNPSKEKSIVLIYGAGGAGVIAKRSIDRDAGSKLGVGGFIDDDKRKVGKKLEGVKIFDATKVHQVINELKPSHLIISTKAIPINRKREIIEIGLQNNMNVLNVPPIQKWINGELSFNQIRKIDVEDLLERSPIDIDTKNISQFVKGKVVLVTGAAGSIGSEISKQLMRYSPSKVILFDIAETPLYELDFELQNGLHKADYEIVIGDVRNKARLNKVFKTFAPKIVFHVAAYKHVPLMENNPSESVYTNVLGTKNLADISIKNEVEKFVFISSDKAVNPTNIMGATKRVAEMYIQALNENSTTKFITTRFGNVLGSNGSVIPLFKKQIKKGGPITVTHPDINRYFMTISEACQLVLQAGTLGKGGEIFVFDMGESVKIVDLAKKMIRLSGLHLGRDIQIVYSGLRPGEKLYEELLADKEKTMPTPHPKITIAKIRTTSLKDVEAEMTKLPELVENNDNDSIVNSLKNLVEEYSTDLLTETKEES